MDIFINDDKIEFKLEKEQTAGDVVEALKEWIKKNNLFLVELFIDNSEYYLTSPEQWSDQEIQSIDKLKVTAVNVTELKVRNLLTLHNYFDLFKRALENSDEKVLHDLMQEYPFILKSLPDVLDSSNKHLISEQIDHIVKGSGLLGALEINQNYREIMISEWGSLLQLFEGRIRELDNPMKEAELAFKNLEQVVEQLENVSVWLQTGREFEAMRVIIQLTEILQKIFRIILLLELADNERKELMDIFSEDLNSVLEEIVEAFSSQDTVLIGDILEYELGPRLQKAPEILDKLHQFTTGGS